MLIAPDRELVLIDLEPLISHIHRILEAAIQNTILYFSQKNRDVNPDAVPDFVRCEAKYLLEQESDLLYTLEELSRNGLSLFYKGYNVRVLKADNGNLPIPGYSKTKQNFYCQQLLLPSPFSDVSTLHELRGIQRSSLNLVFIWDVNLRTGILDLKLVCPKYGDTNRTAIYWDEQIKHPALAIGEENSTSDFTDEMDDFGISFPDTDDEIGNGQMG